MLKENLDKRICDCEEGAENTQTYREYIREVEHDCELTQEPIDDYTEEQLVEYLDELDYYASK